MLELIKPFNFILACDSYKLNHYLEIPSAARYAYSVCVPRKPSKFADKIVAMGQTFVAHMFACIRIEQWMVDEAEIEAHEQGYSFNRTDWEIIVNELGGKLPLAFYAVEEGRVVAPQTPVFGIVNTDDRFVWLPSYVETITQSTVWKMSTVASICREARIILAEFMEKTGTDLSMLDYKLHNFGDRGADGPDEAPVLAGIAHAALFSGSDCTRVNGHIKKLYKTTKAYTSSVEATEHTTMCLNSDAKTKNDFGAAKMAVERLKKVVERTKQGIGIPLLSVVIDTYNSRRFVRVYCGETLKDEIIATGGVMVFRPDSGDATVEPGLVGDDVAATFGSTLNPKGYKVLHPSTSVIQGDGVRIETMRGILVGWVDDAGYSMDSFVLGMGGGITHEGSRDTFSFSVKTVAWSTDGVTWTRLLKEPITDLGKKSLSGLVRCMEDTDGTLHVVDLTVNAELAFAPSAGWKLWFKDGDKTNDQTFDEVRERARS